METFEAKSFTDREIVLLDISKLAKLLDVIKTEDSFLLVWKDAGKKRSKVIQVASISGKVKNGEIELKAEED